MWDYAPPWATAKALVGKHLVHLRSGWSMGIGYETRCGSILKDPADEWWVSADQIEGEDLIGEASDKRTCRKCCLVWLAEAQRS